MAPPLLPITRLVACSSCAQHIKSSESVCPHCGAEHRVHGSVDGRVGRAATAMLMGLALSGCPDKDPEPTASGTDSGGSTTAATDTTTGSSGSETGMTGMTEAMTGDESTTAMPEPEYGVPTTSGEQDYGVPATDSMSGTGDTDPTETGTGTGTSTGSGGEPLYGSGAL